MFLHIIDIINILLFPIGGFISIISTFSEFYIKLTDKIMSSNTDQQAYSPEIKEGKQAKNDKSPVGSPPSSPGKSPSGIQKMGTKVLSKHEQKCMQMAAQLNPKFKVLACYLLKSKKTFVLTPSHFILAKKGFKLNNEDPAFVFPWCNLKELSISPKLILLSFYPTKPENTEEPNSQPQRTDFRMIMSKKEYSTGVAQLCDVLQRVLLPTELKRIEFDKFGAPPVQPCVRSAKYRLLMHDDLNKLHPETVSAVNRIITYGPPMVDLAEIKDATFFVPIFFDILPFLPSIKTVKVPLLKDLPIYELAAKLARNTTTIKALELAGHCKDTLLDFTTAAKENANDSQLTSLSFGVSKSTIEDLELISDMVCNAKINSIGFHSAFREEAVPYFYSSFLSPKVLDNLLSLSLDNTLNIDLTKLLPKLRKVALLSLASCDLNVANAIHMLSLHYNSLPQLQVVNLSGNTFVSNDVDKTKFPHKLAKLPPKLHNFILNDITWPEKTFRNFFEFLFEHIPEKLKLSLSGTLTLQREWKSVFNYLLNCNYTELRELIWDDNSLHPEFFRFLEQNTKLIKLQMNGCFRDQDQSLIEALCRYISHAENLQAVMLRGRGNQYFGKHLIDVLKASLKINKLRLLDVSESHVGETEDEEGVVSINNQELKESLKLVSKIIETSKCLEYINFDGMYPNESADYLNLLQELSHKIHNLKISFPLFDVNYLVNKENASRATVDAIQKMYFFKHPEEELQPPKEPPEGGYKIGYAPTSTLSKPASIYRLYQRSDFPPYVSLRVQKNVSRSSRPLSIPNINEEIDDDLIWDPNVYVSSSSENDDVDLRKDKREMHSDPAIEISSSSSSSSSEKEEEPVQKKFIKHRFGSVRLPRTGVQPAKKAPRKRAKVSLEQIVEERDVHLSDEEDSLNMALRPKPTKVEEATKSNDDQYEESEPESSESSSSATSSSSNRVKEMKQKSKKQISESSESEHQEEKIVINANIVERSHSSSSSSSSDSENKSEKDQLMNELVTPKGLPPLPPKKPSTFSDEILEEPIYDFPELVEMAYPIAWKELDQSISLEEIYDRISSEHRSKVIKKLQKY
ncbi:hypothetical protein TRFO_30929 [Tritrichomonas foetus]|uniref:Leucine Rich Repeat family protein n=1 Tax=Tritrichomonas foetus TaxID=1144522 RepID=A0A1J4JSE1_9EUKA|nr:hypothetical protein TRFO_30929 [Tritrichomonas foetus]|eukprot:OHT02055.1 hypothetical protein TRFO_30929 [Tritrichomonas foetus]